MPPTTAHHSHASAGAFKFLLYAFIAGSAALLPLHARAATVIFLATTGTNNWTVPGDWNSSNNTIEVIGGGGGGGGCSNGRGGGGGGAYSKSSSLFLTPGV